MAAAWLTIILGVQNYEGDVRMLHSLGFDGVKLVRETTWHPAPRCTAYDQGLRIGLLQDDCGAQRNMTLYAELMQSTGKAYTIENCHWGAVFRAAKLG